LYSDTGTVANYIPSCKCDIVVAQKIKTLNIVSGGSWKIKSCSKFPTSTEKAFDL